MEETQNQRSIIVGAVVLAVLVAAILWYVLIVRPGNNGEIAENNPTPTPTTTTGNDTGLAVLPGNQDQEDANRVVNELGQIIAADQLTNDQIKSNPNLDTVSELIVAEGIADAARGEAKGTKDVSPTTETGSAEWVLAGLLAAAGTGLWMMRKLIRFS